MWRNHKYVIQDHVKYMHNYIVKNLRVVNHHYAESFCDIHGTAKYMPPALKEGDEYDQTNWTVSDK